MATCGYGASPNPLFLLRDAPWSARRQIDLSGGQKISSAGNAGGLAYAQTPPNTLRTMAASMRERQKGDELGKSGKHASLLMRGRKICGTGLCLAGKPQDCALIL